MACLLIAIIPHWPAFGEEDNLGSASVSTGVEPAKAGEGFGVDVLFFNEEISGSGGNGAAEGSMCLWGGKSSVCVREVGTLL